MKRAGLTTATIAALMVLFLGLSPQVRAAETVTVFAAASLTNAVTDIAKVFAEKGKGTVVPSFASSSTVAKQIERGAPANVFMSADQEWMNYLAKKGSIVPESRFDLLGNRIVLIAPSESTLKIDIGPKFPLAKLLGSGRLATGDPDHVPAGKYPRPAKVVLADEGGWRRKVRGPPLVREASAGIAMRPRQRCQRR